jgi:hypothetical protein
MSNSLEGYNVGDMIRWKSSGDLGIVVAKHIDRPFNLPDVIRVTLLKNIGGRDLLDARVAYQFIASTISIIERVA